MKAAALFAFARWRNGQALWIGRSASVARTSATRRGRIDRPPARLSGFDDLKAIASPAAGEPATGRLQMPLGRRSYTHRVPEVLPDFVPARGVALQSLGCEPAKVTDPSDPVIRPTGVAQDGHSSGVPSQMSSRNGTGGTAPRRPCDGSFIA